MDKSFRCTSEILKFSTRLLDQSLEVKIFNTNGEEPGIFQLDSLSSINDFTLSEANFGISKNYKSIGLICKSEKNAISLPNLLKDKVNVHLIGNERFIDLTSFLVSKSIVFA